MSFPTRSILGVDSHRIKLPETDFFEDTYTVSAILDFSVAVSS
jgi:hypothetical protein